MISKSSWDASHVSLLFWSKTASGAYAETYNGSTAAADDVIFTNATETTAKTDFIVDGVTGQYRTLSADEWQYLFSYGGTEMGPFEGTDYSNEKRENKYKLFVNVCGKSNCVILLPDDWTWGGAVGNNWQEGGYSEATTVKWSEMAAAGAVCLPCVDSFREGTTYYTGGSQYWTSSIDGAGYAYRARFDNDITYGLISSEGRQQGRNVRLVTDVPVE